MYVCVCVCVCVGGGGGGGGVKIVREDSGISGEGTLMGSGNFSEELRDLSKFWLFERSPQSPQGKP